MSNLVVGDGEARCSRGALQIFYYVATHERDHDRFVVRPCALSADMTRNWKDVLTLERGHDQIPLLVGTRLGMIGAEIMAEIIKSETIMSSKRKTD